MSGRKAKKRITSNTKTIRTTVPITLLQIRDKYKKKICNNIKDKHKGSLSNKIVFELILKCIKDIPEKEIINKIPKKYLK